MPTAQTKRTGLRNDFQDEWAQADEVFNKAMTLLQPALWTLGVARERAMNAQTPGSSAEESNEGCEQYYVAACQVINAATDVLTKTSMGRRNAHIVEKAAAKE